MQTHLLQCNYCGTPLDPRNVADGVIECPNCQNALTVEKPSCSPEAKQFLAIGAHELDICRFDDAFEAYKKAAELSPDEPQAYFGMALASERVQFIKDIVNDRMQPIKHEISDKKITDNANFKKAFALGTDAQKRVYARRAKDIVEIGEHFYRLAAENIDYDVFICCKVTDNNTGKKTEDYIRALEIYTHLLGCGFKPFFSETVLKGQTGSEYEAYILYALYMSESMIIVCDNEEYLNTPWVKNEYSRFGEMIANEEKEIDSITIAYSGKVIEKLPGRQGKIQGVDLDRPTAYSIIEKFVRSHLDSKNQKKSVEQTVAEQMEKMRAEYEAKLAEAQSSAARVAEQAAAKAAEEAAKRAAEQASKTAEQAATKTAATDMSGFTAGMSDAEFFERMEAYNKEKQRRAEEERLKREEEERKRREEERRIAEEQRRKAEEEKRKRQEKEP